MSRPIGTLGAVDTITVGERVFTNVSTLITLRGYVTDGTNKWTGFRQPNASSGYVVPGGKSFQVCAVSSTALGTVTVGDGIGLGYANNDLGIGSTTAPSSPNYIIGDSSGTGANVTVFSTTAAGSKVSAAVDFTVPTGKYLFSTNFGASESALVTIYGYEI